MKSKMRVACALEEVLVALRHATPRAAAQRFVGIAARRSRCRERKATSKHRIARHGLHLAPELHTRIAKAVKHTYFSGAVERSVVKAP